MKTKNLLYILPLAALVACEPEIDEVEFSNGSADFSKTVAVGNSLSAGFQSGALDLDGQLNSLPAIIANQMREVGGGEFKQPLLTGELATKGVGVDLSIIAQGMVQPRFALKNTTDCLGATSVGPARLTEPYAAIEFVTGAPGASVAADGPFNNVSVPGAKLTDLANPAYANPFFARIRPLGSTMLSLAADVQASFFLMWIGNNDVLGYATEGGDDNLVGATLTDNATFNTQYNAAVTAMISSGADQGIVANIPNVTSIPYFTTVPIGTDAVTETDAAALNSAQAYGAYNAGLDAAAADTSNAITKGFTQEMADARKIVFVGGQVNTFVVVDPSLYDLTAVNPALRSLRQIRPGELLTLATPGDSLLCAGWGTAVPIPGNYHLTASEIQKINDATTAYNATIKTAADVNGLAFFDANARLKQLATTGITASGIDFSAALITGQAFSFDGVHPSTRGYAILANDFIDAINSKYSSSIPKVEVGSYATFEIEQ